MTEKLKSNRDLLITVIMFGGLVLLLAAIGLQDTRADFDWFIPATPMNRATPGQPGSASGYNANFDQQLDIWRDFQATMTPCPLFWDGTPAPSDLRAYFNGVNSYDTVIIRTVDPDNVPLALHYWNDSSAAQGGSLTMERYRGYFGSSSNVQDGDRLPGIKWIGYYSGNYTGASIYATIDAAPGASDMPSTLYLATSPDGGAVPTPGWWMDSNQDVFQKGNLSVLAGASILPHTAGVSNPFTGMTIENQSVSVGAGHTPVGTGTPIPSLWLVEGNDGGAKYVSNNPNNLDSDFYVYAHSTGTPVVLQHGDASTQAMNFPQGIEIAGTPVYSATPHANTPTPYPTLDPATPQWNANALLGAPLTTDSAATGAMILFGGTNWNDFAVGAAGTILTSSGTAPGWATLTPTPTPAATSTPVNVICVAADRNLSSSGYLIWPYPGWTAGTEDSPALIHDYYAIGISFKCRYAIDNAVVHYIDVKDGSATTLHQMTMTGDGSKTEFYESITPSASTDILEGDTVRIYYTDGGGTNIGESVAWLWLQRKY